MIAHNLDINCTNARLYYYDFLNEENREGIPDGALQHIKQCRNCQAEMDRLKDLLVKAEERFGTGQSRKDSAISTLLKLHFDYIGEPVKCNTVKPFLASLADPVLQIRIPTPITTHLDKCRSCRDDLKILLDLHLPHKYLCRLGRLLADKPTEDDLSCSEARAAIPDVVSMDFQETDADILKHLCTCPDCREQLYQHRESVREELMRDGAIDKGFPCESVTAADIYDYCLPYGLDPADDEYVEFREFLTVHLRRCPTCLSKVQKLHRTISNIAGRAESGVITIYNIEESVENKSSSESESYITFPISADTAVAEETLCSKQPKTINLAARLKQKVPVLNVRPLLKAGLIAAAVITIGFAFLFSSSPAGAVTIEQICQAIQKAKNVYIAKFNPGKVKPDQERWVSRSLNVYLTKTGEESVLMDLGNKVMSIKNINAGSIKTSPLSTETITATETMMNGLLGLVPFADVSVIPEDAEWDQVGNDDLQTISKTIEIYEMKWLKRTYAGATIFNRWLFFIDPKTNLPQKIESYIKSATDNEYALLSTFEVKYLRGREMKAVVDEASL
jgi:hypothetical protein